MRIKFTATADGRYVAPANRKRPVEYRVVPGFAGVWVAQTVTDGQVAPIGRYVTASEARRACEQAEAYRIPAP